MVKPFVIFLIKFLGSPHKLAIQISSRLKQGLPLLQIFVDVMSPTEARAPRSRRLFIIIFFKALMKTVPW